MIMLQPTGCSGASASASAVTLLSTIHLLLLRFKKNYYCYYFAGSVEAINNLRAQWRDKRLESPHASHVWIFRRK